MYQCESYPSEKLDRFTTGLEHHKEAAKSLSEHKSVSTEERHEFYRRDGHALSVVRNTVIMKQDEAATIKKYMDYFQM
ncbi:hypothetical protein [uncultured Clostridium sp.]|uniref:hypothetical protein n=1 Tax=uncultured Clostridium sp. TaxID=59620 RepID=UPI0025DAB36E|nr:hypothetical protein [uncultured Clostridium sp.]